MLLTPIKLLKDELFRNTLLNIKGETEEIDGDDYIESRITTNAMAKNLLAIEDASEMAKSYIHKRGFFERIANDIKEESCVDFTFNCSKTTALHFERTKRIEYALMEVVYDDGSGHYGMACVDHRRKACIFYDSMAKEVSDFQTPLVNALRTGYTLHISDHTPQPSGGFVADSFKKFKKREFSAGVPKARMKDAYELSQYDELSQHHFCYIESFLSMMVSLGLADRGPHDPRERLVYVKRFVWGVLHKYTPIASRETARWKYFKTNFPYILETFDPNGGRLEMVLEYLQVPPKKGDTVLKLKKLNLRRDIDHTWTLEKIAKWSNL